MKHWWDMMDVALVINKNKIKVDKMERPNKESKK